jgi:hypothetical protein
LRCSRSWLATPTRWAMRSLRARQVAFSAAVAGLSGVNGRSRARSVRRVSASANASNRSSLLPAEPYRAAQVLELIRTNDGHGDPGVEQGVDHRPVRAFDGHLLDAVTGQRVAQLPQSGGAVLNGQSQNLAAAGVHYRYRVVVTGPVDTARQSVGGFSGRASLADFTSASSPLVPVRRHPYLGAGVQLRLRSLFGAPRRSALSTVGTPRVTAGLRKTHAGRPRVKRAGR